MTKTNQRNSKAPKETSTVTSNGRLYLLDLSGGRVLTLNTDGTGMSTIASGCRMPDGVAVDTEKGHIYWTNMGVPSRNDGSIERADLSGLNRQTIVPQGATFTPKQLHLDHVNQKLYWSDREGMRVMRANLDGSQIETLVQTGQSDSDRQDQKRWCVGIAVDPGRGHFYWTQKGADDAGQGRIFRANIQIPKGEVASNRSDIEVLFDGLPEPIDLELDLKSRLLYWTDRGDPPRGNTVSRASVAGVAGQLGEPQILVTHLMEGIGLALDIPGNRMFVTDLAGSVYSASLDGTQKRAILMAQGNLTGIAYVS